MLIGPAVYDELPSPLGILFTSAEKLFRRKPVSNGNFPFLALGVCISLAISCAAVFQTASSLAWDFATH
jgi:hypothetical protein